MGDFNDKTNLISENEEMNEHCSDNTVVIPIPESLSTPSAPASANISSETEKKEETPSAITCEVCHSKIDLTGKKISNGLVKCGRCNEVTAFKDAPQGRSYFRCPCRALLVHDKSIRIIVCARKNCRKLINLETNIVRATSSETSRINCGHCHKVCVFDMANKQLIRCPHCRKISSVGPHFAKNRSLFFFIASLIFFTIGFVVTFGIGGNVGSLLGINSVFIIAQCFVLGILLISRSIYLWFLEVSFVLGPLDEPNDSTRF